MKSGVLDFILALGLAAATGSPLAAQECQPLDTPKRLPGVDRLVDSAALVAGLAAAGPADSARITLTLTYPRRGGPPSVTVLGSGEGAEGSELRSRVEALLRPKGAPPGTSLRLDIRSPTDVRVERSVLCPPVPFDSTALMSVFVASGGAEARPLPRFKSNIQVQIGADGEVLDARLRPGSGRSNIDRLVLEPVFNSRWHPATVDGRPVTAWLFQGRASLSKRP
jgi:hypothetical protein